MADYGFGLERKDRNYGTTFFGKYRGEVIDIEDPLKMGRIKGRCPRVLGPLGETNWALPNLPPGFKCLPQVGDKVWFEFEEGDPDYPIWTGVWFTQDEYTPETTELVLTAETVFMNDRKPLEELDTQQEELDAHQDTLDNHESRISSLGG
jgi:hypothetical protein